MFYKRFIAIFYAILAAVLFGLNAPFSKVLLNEITPTLMASLLYIGAGVGMLLIKLIINISNKNKESNHIKKDQFIYVVGMIVLDIIAPILLMVGLTKTNPENVSLLNNFEIVATSIIAFIIFRESISRKLLIAIVLITISSFILSFENLNSLSFSIGSLFVILACISWGFENNFTRKLSTSDPLQVVIIKGFGSGFGAFLIALYVGIETVKFQFIIYTLGLGFISYGLSIYFYVSAQKDLGASKTSAFYAFAPFVGVGISLIIFKDLPSTAFIIALLIMIIGAYLSATDYHKHKHVHEKVSHEHSHSHNDGHHDHIHKDVVVGEHTHMHSHDKVVHNHIHVYDLHHIHNH